MPPTSGASTPRSSLEGLSSTTVHHLHAVIHRALNSAVEDGKLSRNVASLIGRSNRPKVARREMVTIAEGDQPRRFLTAAKGERLEALLVLALTTGLRKGELRALRWKDVDLERGVLAVRGSLMGTARADMAIGTPKNGKERAVSLGTTAVSALGDHRARQLEERKVCRSVVTSDWCSAPSGASSSDEHHRARAPAGARARRPSAHSVP